jgi:hypothetical protein
MTGNIGCCQWIHLRWLKVLCCFPQKTINWLSMNHIRIVACRLKAWIAESARTSIYRQRPATKLTDIRATIRCADNQLLDNGSVSKFPWSKRFRSSVAVESKGSWWCYCVFYVVSRTPNDGQNKKIHPFSSSSIWQCSCVPSRTITYQCKYRSTQPVLDITVV